MAAASHPFPGFGTDSPLSYDPVVADGTFAGLLGSMDADVNRRGRQFERVVRWWLGNVLVNPFAPHRIEDVWLWDEWPDRPGPDIGIDLVARLSDGSLCAVQAKCIDEAADIPKSQLDSFVSAASTAVFAHRLLVATHAGSTAAAAAARACCASAAAAR